MAVVIDRRLNPPGKNLPNRQRFLERVRDKIKKTIKDSIESKNIKDIGNNEEVKVRSKDISEPSFQKNSKSGSRERVLPGNKKYSEGDVEEKPSSNGGSKGNKPSKGESEDDFVFTLTKDEFLNYLFEDLELPDFIKESLKVTDAKKWNRSGFTSSGSPANLNIERTFKKSIGRRLALHRPSDNEVDLAFKLYEEEIDSNKKAILLEEWEELLNKQKRVPYIEENDLQYTLYQEQPIPTSQAVMFCLMDVSGSMGVVEKDISKRFFLLLYLFLERRYDKIEIRFIRHTHVADEVDEHTFFYNTQSGGTQISSGLELICDIIHKDYNPIDWNIYIAQCTDGDNYPDDNDACENLIRNKLQKIVQYYAYIQVSEYNREQYIHSIYGSFIYTAYPMFERLANTYKNIECKKISDKRDIWSVFCELFQRKN